MPPELAEPLDCRSPEGVTVGLIDGIIAAARVLRGRDLSHPAVREALADLAEDEDVAELLQETPLAGRGSALSEPPGILG